MKSKKDTLYTPLLVKTLHFHLRFTKFWNIREVICLCLKVHIDIIFNNQET